MYLAAVPFGALRAAVATPRAPATRACASGPPDFARVEMEAYWEGKKSRLLAEQESTLAKLAELEAREQLYFESTKAAKAELAAALGGAAPAAAAPGAKIAQLAATEAVVSPEASEEIEALRLELMAAEMEREVDVQLTSAFWIERERKLKEAALSLIHI